MTQSEQVYFVKDMPALRALLITMGLLEMPMLKLVVHNKDKGHTKEL